MKNIFKGYYKLSDQELMALWKNALFVFDTNILMDLYRYQSSAREDLFKVMEDLDNRVWVPYHVGLEFQRNRLSVIAEREKKFSEIKKAVQQSIVISEIKEIYEDLKNKKRRNINPHIDPDELIGFLKSLEKVQKIQQDFLKKFNELEKKGISVNSEDKIRDRIDALFMEKIGNEPKDQKEIDEIFREGETRYKNEIPPGYEDSSKSDEFTYAGLTYKQQYGDLIIWKQIISYASENSVKNLVFVTNDQKVDWWWKEYGKKIGVRPELSDEIFREAGVEKFHIFNIESFLYYANKQPNVKVTEETIKEVREVSDDRRERVMHSQMMRQLGSSAEAAVYEWLLHNFPLLALQPSGHRYLDFIGYRRDGREYGFKVRLVRSVPVAMMILREAIYRFYYMLNEEGFYEIAIIFVVLDEEIIPELRPLIRRSTLEGQRNLKIIIGKAEYSEEEGRVYDFTPYDDFNLGDHPG